MNQLNTGIDTVDSTAGFAMECKVIDGAVESEWDEGAPMKISCVDIKGTININAACDIKLNHLVYEENTVGLSHLFLVGE